jgi:hypothetical protein
LLIKQFGKFGKVDLGAENGSRHVDFRDINQNSGPKFVAVVSFLVVVEAGTGLVIRSGWKERQLALSCP